ncbi:para-aminobenzoate synthase component I [Neisseria gonorrhoeae]|uniref:Para-aminobenzoate synthase component I n=1 Tax=Neisseria gonorrhoeae TaxID=485 RepID=A0A378W366_NEIGO|nr:para-aminobenzoate synthase component I [Neisseria gonorrhoeae]
MPSENLRPSPQPAPARRLRKSNQTIHCRLARRRVPHQSPARFRRHQPVPRRFKPSDRQTARHHFADHPARTKLPAPLQTTHRAIFDQAWQTAETQGAFDSLFFNSDGILLEGGRSNVFVKHRGQWLTPSLDLDILNGIMRQAVSDEPQNICTQIK